MKILTIDGFLPDEKTLPSKYMFYQDYNVVVHGNPTGKIKEFLNFAISDVGASIIKSIKHIPIAQEAINKRTGKNLR